MCRISGNFNIRSIPSHDQSALASHPYDTKVLFCLLNFLNVLFLQRCIQGGRGNRASCPPPQENKQTKKLLIKMREGQKKSARFTLLITPLMYFVVTYLGPNRYRHHLGARSFSVNIYLLVLHADNVAYSEGKGGDNPHPWAFDKFNIFRSRCFTPSRYSGKCYGLPIPLTSTNQLIIIF